jgi:hypothetical protein
MFKTIEKDKSLYDNINKLKHELYLLTSKYLNTLDQRDRRSILYDIEVLTKVIETLNN